MKDSNYSEKELAIFNGVMDLIKSGANVYLVTVSEIAKASGVGKGTIYGYFSTKEEIISESILYNLENELKHSIDRIEKIKGFKDKYYEALNMIVENFHNKFSTINMLLSIGGFDEFYEYIVDKKQRIPLYISRIDKILDNLLKIGYEERIISMEECQYYKRMVIKSSIAGFINYINTKEYHVETSTQEAMDLSYKMIIKALN